MQFNNLHNKHFRLNLSSDSEDFDQIYLENFPTLHRYAYTILNDRELAEEMVHQVFLKILERTEPVDLHTSLKSYLLRSVNNECLNYIKHQKVRQNYHSYAIHSMRDRVENPSSKLACQELELHIAQAINDLPEQCRTIFQLSRFEDLKYGEIAIQLGISVKTVESHMRKALKRLRLELADYLPLIGWIVIIKVWY